jgi:hypothetical protein
LIFPEEISGLRERPTNFGFRVYRIIAEMGDEIVFRAVLALLARYFADPNPEFVTEYDRLLSVAESRFPPGFAESAVECIVKWLTCPPSDDLRKLDAVGDILERMVASDVYHFEYPYSELVGFLRSGNDDLGAYARTQSDSENVVNAVCDCYIRTWSAAHGREPLFAVAALIVLSGGAIAKLIELRLVMQAEQFYAGMRGTAVGAKQFVFEAIANPVTRGDFRSVKGREFFVDVFGRLNDQEIGEMLARMWSGAEANDKVVWDITAYLFKAFPKRRELLRGLLPVKERPRSADPEIQ